MRIESFWGRPTNAHYDPRKANDGGGYWQFEGGALFITSDGRPVVMEVRDTSCGWFGSRMELHAEVSGHTVDVYWGTMEDFWHREPTCKELKPLCRAARISIREARRMIRDTFAAANLAAEWQFAAEQKQSPIDPIREAIQNAIASCASAGSDKGR